MLDVCKISTETPPVQVDVCAEEEQKLKCGQMKEVWMKYLAFLQFFSSPLAVVADLSALRSQSFASEQKSYGPYIDSPVVVPQSSMHWEGMC